MRALTKARRSGLVTVFGVLALGASVSCDHPPHHAGSVDVIVTVPGDIAVDTLAFAVSGDNFGPLTGGLHVSKPQERFEKLINGIPAGDDDEVDVSAKSVDGKFACKQAAKVSVRQNTVTRVLIALACLNADEGNILVNVSVVGVDCSGAHLADYTVSPLTAAVGAPIAVTATMTQSDAGLLSYDWSAPSGTFDDPSSAKTTYRCAAAGLVTLNLRVGTGSCAEDQSVQVDCVGPSKDATGD